MKSVKSDAWSCRNCDAVASGEPKWWPTIQRASKFETSVGVCKLCFRDLAAQLKFENKPVKTSKPKTPAKGKKVTKKQVR